MTLFQHPDQLAELKANRSLAAAFVDELCRYHTASALAMKRTAKVDIELGGQVRIPLPHPFPLIRSEALGLTRYTAAHTQHIKAGEGIIASNQSANRDEDVFADADAFDMHRWQRRPPPPPPEGSRDPLGFGYGEHRCIAERLAKAELAAVFAQLFEKLPGLGLAVPAGEVEHTPLDKDVGITELPVAF